MESKKTEKKTDWKRIGRIAVVCLPVVAVVLIIAVVLSTTVLFKVKNFDIVGAKRYTTQQIVEASGLKEGKNMFVSNVNKAQEELCAKLPYIEEAEIKRKLPNSIVIEIKENKESYALNAGSEWFIINAQGKILEILGNKQPEKSLIKVYTTNIYNPELGKMVSYSDPEKTTQKDEKGEEKEKTPLELFNTILKEINKTNLKGKIGVINLINTDSVVLQYDSRIKLSLGEPKELEAKLKLAAGAVENEDKINPNQKGEMDLTVSQQAHFLPESRQPSK